MHVRNVRVSYNFYTFKVGIRNSESLLTKRHVPTTWQHFLYFKVGGGTRTKLGFELHRIMIQMRFM